MPAATAITDPVTTHGEGPAGYLGPSIVGAVFSFGGADRGLPTLPVCAF